MVNPEEEKEALPEISVKDTVEEINKNPIVKPILEYKKTAKVYEKMDSTESEFLKKKLDYINTVMGKDILEISPPAKCYADLCEVYQRLLLIYQKNIELAERIIIELYKINKQNYKISDAKAD